MKYPAENIKNNRMVTTMLNFAMGPVQADDSIRAIGAEQVPYFRTPEFSSVMLESERLVKKLAKAGDDARAVFLTGSGTAAMEAAVMNLFTQEDKLLVVNGGSFGQRFAELCRIHSVPYAEIKLSAFEPLTAEQLAPYQESGYTGLLVNLHETSTGVCYDIAMISDFCRQNGMFLLVDAISSFLADPFDMETLGVDAMITSSQKVLACPPGISILVLSAKAVRRVEQARISSMYFDIKNALENGVRGQTPFTPAVGILLQIHARLREIDTSGGAEAEITRIREQAENFRAAIQGLPLCIASEHMSNAMTPLHPLNVSAYSVFETLKDRYGIWVCPNGGDLRDYVFRVGHIGALTKGDNDVLLILLRITECCCW